MRKLFAIVETDDNNVYAKLYELQGDKMVLLESRKEYWSYDIDNEIPLIDEMIICNVEGIDFSLQYL